jgi:hypothetical protein
VTQNIPSTAAPATETIIRAVSQGGSVTLSALRGPSGWAHFTVVADESTMIEQLGEDPDEELSGYLRTAGPAETWKGAVELLDRFVWPILHPGYVHPEFRQMVIAAVRERAADKGNPLVEFVEDWLPDWERACSQIEEV